MKLKSKIILTNLILIIEMFFIPLILVYISNPQDAMGILIIFLFILNPFISLIIGIISGFEFKKMWWEPILTCFIFLISYWIILQDIILDFFIYAFIYLAFGSITMLITFLLRKNNTKK